MPECTFISKRFLALIVGLMWITSLTAADSRAQGTDMSIPDSQVGGAPAPRSPGNPTNPAIPTGAKKDDAGTLFDQANSPYLEYGDFNSQDEEDADTYYFQYGRFFGISLGLGYEAATGNRGLLYQPAVPRFDLKVHYWFDFQFAVNLGIFFANHSFDYGGKTETAKMIGYGLDLKYYFDVRNSAAALSFSNPFIIGGIGAISKNQSSATSIQPTADSTMSVSMGAGLEFPISYKKTYLILEGRYHTQSFADTISPDYKNRVTDLSGGFMTVMFHLLFTW